MSLTPEIDRRFRRRWLAMALVSAVVLALLILTARANGYTCEDAKRYRIEIETMPPEVRRIWIKKLGITKKQVRQARKCLREG